MVSSDGIKVDPVKVEAVLGWERSKTPTEVRSFMGLGDTMGDLFKPLLK